MVKKVPVIWEGTTRTHETNFNRGLIVSDYEELYFLTGQVDSDLDGSCRHPGDPVAQSQGVLDSMVGMLAQEGWSLDDVIRVELTVTKEVDIEDTLQRIFKTWADTFKDVETKPASGTTRVSYSLARAGYFVEYDFIAAR